MPHNILVDEATINSLEITLEREREIFNAKKSVLNELEQKEETRRLTKIEILLSCMHRERSLRLGKNENGSSIVHECDNGAIDQFLLMEKEPAIEALNFLLTEFFTNSYPGKKWDDLFISDLVFNVTRTVTMLSGLK